MAEKIKYNHKIMGSEYEQYLSSSNSKPEQNIIKKGATIETLQRLTNHSETETLKSGENVEFDYSFIQQRQKEGEFTVVVSNPLYHITAKVNGAKVADCYYNLSEAGYPGELGFGINLLDKNFAGKGIEEKLVAKIENVADSLKVSSMNTVYGAFEGTSIDGNALESIGYKSEVDHGDHATYFIKLLNEKTLESNPNAPQGPNQ